MGERYGALVLSSDRYQRQCSGAGLYATLTVSRDRGCFPECHANDGPPCARPSLAVLVHRVRGAGLSGPSVLGVPRPAATEAA